MEIFMDGLAMPESGRWHDGRLWFCHWVAQQVVAVDADGKAEYLDVPVENLMGWSIEWLPDGRMITTGDKIRVYDADGTATVLSEQGANEVVVDAHGNLYLDGADFNFSGGEAPKPGWIKLLTPAGELREVAGGIEFPNGMVLTGDGRTLVIAESFAGRLTAFDVEPDGGLTNRRTLAEDLGPDGIVLDAEGAIWVQTGGEAVVRVSPTGEILDRIDLPEHRAPFSVTLGTPNGQPTLYALTSIWYPDDSIVDNLTRIRTGPRTGQIFAETVTVPPA